ncbi:MAG: TonB-dependent receptor [Bacteroidales bacterium]|nr:TonB-dependent receptor [Bacteroidales bacterium]MDD4670451.1 TonB-dependent receptor [Bacteroidales bacterium]
MKKLLLMLILSAISIAAVAQIKGKVIDGANGEPFMGVSVLIKGTMVGAETQADGSFTLPAQIGDIVLFSFIGYLEQEVKITDNRELNITLMQDTNLITEIVVVGYGSQKKSDVTGAVASFNTKQLEERPNANIIQTLQGAIAGLNISMTGSDAEGSMSSTRIRSNNSISASNKPLIILDGIPFSGSWSEINSNDVESIEVLKDASSSAIYGARGSNGVILIQTKKGKGEKVAVSYNGYISMNKAINIPQMMDGETFFQRKTESGGDMTMTEIEMHDKGQSTDWLGLALRTGYKMQHNVSFRGASKTTRYYFSANMNDNRGIAVNDDFSRYSLRFNLEQDLGKWVKFGTNTRYGYYDRSGNNINFSSAYLMNPLGSPYYEDGSLRLQVWEDNNYANNPLSALNELNNDITRSLVTNNYIDVKFPVKGLTYRLNTGYSYKTRLYQNYQGLDTVNGLANGGVLNIANTYSEDWLIENILSYTREFGKHTIFLTGLYSAQYEDRIANSIEASNFPNDVMTYWQPNKAASTSTSASRTTMTHVSQMIRANYSYDSRYLFTFTARRDGYSAFGENKKYGIFPSVALGWNVVNEDFVKDSGFGRLFNNFKVRLSWGKNGNEAIDAYSTLPVLRGKNYLTDDYSAAFGFYPSQLASPLLGWETTTSFNAGIDFGLLNNRIKGTLDLYTTNTYDLLLWRTIPSINGTSSVLENIGKTKGRGIEFQVSSVNVTNKNFTWSTDFNIVHSSSEIVDVGLYDDAGNAMDDIASGWFVGYPVSVNYDYLFDGIHQVGESVSYTSPLSQPGYVKYWDLDGDGVIDTEDRGIIGSREPSFTFGMNNTFFYKNLSLSIFVNGSVGATYPNYLLSTHTLSYRQNQLNKEFWTEANPINTYPANIGDGSVNTKRMDFYEKTDYLRIKDVSLAYRFPEKISKKIALSRLEVYINAKNLYTWTSWSGLDPEFVSSGSNQRAIPQTLELLFGLRFDF